MSKKDNADDDVANSNLVSSIYQIQNKNSKKPEITNLVKN